MIIKNKIPILEFDTDETSVIVPTHENLNLNLLRIAVFAFFDELFSDSYTHFRVYATKANLV